MARHYPLHVHKEIIFNQKKQTIYISIHQIQRGLAGKITKINDDDRHTRPIHLYCSRKMANATFGD